MTLHRSDFKDLDDYGFPYPQLILGINIPDHGFLSDGSVRKHLNYTMSPEREWLYLCHQTGGLACHHHYMIGTALTPKSETIKTNLQKLNDKWLDSNTGVFGVSLTEINDYAKDLESLFKVTCEIPWTDFEEAIYPVDCNDDTLGKLTKDKMPEHLDDFIIWEDPKQRLFGCINRWTLWILGENCD